MFYQGFILLNFGTPFTAMDFVLKSTYMTIFSMKDLALYSVSFTFLAAFMKS